MSVISEKITATLNQIDLGKTLWVAFSGGIDSTVLLHAIYSASKITGHNVKAIHVDHQIHQDSKQWSEFCEKQCKYYSIPVKTITVDLQSVSDKGVEGAARLARYQAFEQCLSENDVLFTAHHADDQLETILLQLFRGAGVQGLTGCAAQRDLGESRVIRPLLEVSREQIEAYAGQHNLNWLNDPSNDLVEHDRNYLRHEVMPLLHQRWQGLRETVARSSQWQIESAQLLDYLAQLTLNNELENPLPIEKLKKLDGASMKNALRWWIRANKFPMPSAQIIKHIITDVINSAEDSEACMKWQDCELRKYRDKIYLQEQLSSHDPSQSHEWRINTPLEFASLNLLLTKDKLQEFGVHCDNIKMLRVKFRQGGEVMRPRGRGCQKDLKSLFQEAGVEPWLRDRIPLLYDDDSLVCVWGYWIQEGY